MKTKMMILMALACGTMATAVSWDECLSQSDTWYGSAEALRIAENCILYQRASGGWPKNTDMADVLDEAAKAAVAAQKNENDATIDNWATCQQMRFLARVYKAGGKADVRESFLRGLDYILKAQYDNGGWPQFYPDPTGYHRYITFNDNAMINVLNLLQDIADGQAQYAFLDVTRKTQVQTAIQKGVDCILKCQIVHGGKRLAWCAQHDEKTFEPQAGRIYEKVSISGSESAGIIRFLMRYNSPDPRVEQAVEAGIRWFEDAKVTGFRWQRIGEPNAPKGYDCKLIPDEKAPPLWARFYEISTNRPIFCDRDGVIHYDVKDISIGRRTGYSWYVSSPQTLLKEEYPAWREKRNP